MSIIYPKSQYQTDVFNVKDFGAKGDGIVDDTSAFASAIQNARDISIEAGGASVEVPEGIFRITSPLVIDDGIALVGRSHRGSRITWYPTASGQVLFTLGDGTAQQSGNSIRNLELVTTSSYSTTLIKTRDVSQCWVDYVFIRASAVPSGTDTIGMDITGRENSTFSNLRIFAPTPIRMSAYPGEPTGIDNHNFHNLYLSAQPLTTNNISACVWIDDTTPSAISFTGRQAYAKGDHAVYWKDPDHGTTLTIASFDNIRFEQPYDTSKASFHVELGTTQNNKFQDISFKNCHGSPNAAGFYLRGIRGVSLINCSTDTGGDYAIDASRCQELSILTSDLLGEFRISNMMPVWASARYLRQDSRPRSSIWIEHDDAYIGVNSQPFSYGNNCQIFSRTTYLDTAGVQTFALNENEKVKFATLFVTAVAMASGDYASGQFVVVDDSVTTDGGAYRGIAKVSGTTNINDLPNQGAGTVNVYASNSQTHPIATVNIQNQIGQPIYVQMYAIVHTQNYLTRLWPAAPPWASGVAVEINDQYMNDGNIYRSQTDGTTGETGPTHTSGTASDGVVTWLYESTP